MQGQFMIVLLNIQIIFFYQMKNYKKVEILTHCFKIETTIYQLI